MESSFKRNEIVLYSGTVYYAVHGAHLPPTFETVNEILTFHHSVTATEQYFPVVLFIVLYKVVLSFESVDEIQLWRCFFYAVKVVLTFECPDETLVRFFIF